MYGVNSGYSGVGAYQTTPRYGQQYESYGAYQPGIYQPQQAMPAQQAQGASGGAIKGRPVSSEEETKEVLEEICERMNRTNMVADCEYVKDMLLDVEKEIKKIDRMKNSLNGTGYDVNMIHSVQDKYHEKYKKKYDDHYTTKNNYRPYPYPPYGDDDDDEPEDAVRRRRRRIGYMY